MSAGNTGGERSHDAAVPSRPWRVRRLVPGILPAAVVGGLALTSGVALTATSGRAQRRGSA